MDGRLINDAFEELAQGLRVLLEAHSRANRDGLLFVDRPEAVGNIDVGLSCVLNSFHSLYDAIAKQLGTHPVNWYKTGALATVLAIRNARHHNKANRIRSLYTFHVHESAAPNRIEQYVYVDYPSKEDDADTFEVFLSWGDFRDLLKLPASESRLSAGVSELILDYINASEYPGYARWYDLAEQQVFFNVVPLFVNAGIEVIPGIRQYCKPASTESEYFLWHFCNIERADTINHQVDCGPFVLPE